MTTTLHPTAAPTARSGALALSVVILAAVSGCGGSDQGTPPPERVLLVTTTTVEASGLLEELVTAYHASQNAYRLSVTALGSGAALELGRRGDADLLITHDPIGEAEFMDAGHGAEQGPLMRNEFIVVGPPDDPAGIRRMTDLAAAMDEIAAAGASFVSRGDESGTHRRERQLWSRVGRAPWQDAAGWYIESGSGMDETLRIADQRNAYALSGRSTFLNLRDGLRLESLARGNPPEVNAYQWTLPTAPANPAGARHLRNWLLGPGQDVVAEYGIDEFGEPLFTPTATALDTLPPAGSAPSEDHSRGARQMDDGSAGSPDPGVARSPDSAV